MYGNRDNGNTIDNYKNRVIVKCTNTQEEKLDGDRDVYYGI